MIGMNTAMSWFHPPSGMHRSLRDVWAAWIVFVTVVGVSHAIAQVRPMEADPDVDAVRSQPIKDDEFNLPLEDADAQRMDQLVSALAGPDFAAREKAATELIEIGAPAFKPLREAYHRANDLESRLRIEEVVRSAYLNHHVLNRYGFLGISMTSIDSSPGKMTAAHLQQFGNPQLPVGRVGVVVTQIIPNTGAERAGLQKNDVLLAINGQAVAGVGLEIRDSFSAIIRQHGPGAKVQLEVLRAREVLNIEAVLGRPPENVAKNSGIIKVSPLFHAVSDRFITWWDTYFLRAGETASETP